MVGGDRYQGRHSDVRRGRAAAKKKRGATVSVAPPTPASFQVSGDGGRWCLGVDPANKAKVARVTVAPCSSSKTRWSAAAAGKDARGVYYALNVGGRPLGVDAKGQALYAGSKVTRRWQFLSSDGGKTVRLRATAGGGCIQKDAATRNAVAAGSCDAARTVLRFQ
jgi:hypothetical protein